MEKDTSVQLLELQNNVVKRFIKDWDSQITILSTIEKTQLKQQSQDLPVALKTSKGKPCQTSVT